MRHILTKPPEGLREMRCWQAPNLFVFSRAECPPIPGGKSADDGLDDNDDEPTKPGTKRALVGMSRKSSLNVARLLSCLDWKKHGSCFHVTLTYHREWPLDSERLRLAKQALVMSVSRQCVAGLWRLEYQTRKEGLRVPHWHLLVWLGDRDLAEFEHWLRKWWAKHSENASEHGCHVTQGDQARGTWYLAMHAAKREQSPPFAVGRWWGCINRAVFNQARDVGVLGAVGSRELVWAARLFRRATGGKNRNAGGFSWFLPRAWQWRVLAWVRDQCEEEAAHRADPRNRSQYLRATLARPA